MKKFVLSVAALTCLSLCGWAQSYPDAAQPNTSGQTAGAPSASASNSGSPTMTVDGCLSGAGGSYQIKDKSSGTTYTLAGDTSKLANHVGHEVQIMGTTSGSGSSAGSASSATATGNTSSLGGSQTLTVTSFKHIASSCSSM